jgi:hypothetical protein
MSMEEEAEPTRISPQLFDTITARFRAVRGPNFDQDDAQDLPLEGGTFLGYFTPIPSEPYPQAWIQEQAWVYIARRIEGQPDTFWRHPTGSDNSEPVPLEGSTQRLERLVIIASDTPIIPEEE